MMGSNDGLENVARNTNPFSVVSIGGGVGSTRSWGATVSGQSVSSNGSPGSPSTRSDDAAMAVTPASENTFLRLNHLDIHGDDDDGSQGAVGKKKKRAPRATGGDKGGRGLRQFSMKVCEKVESKGRTTYNEVADELVAEFADPGNGDQASDQKQYDEKNIRRRVYDALNVLMAMDIISKDKKEIQWRGLPRTSLNDIEELKRPKWQSWSKHKEMDEVTVSEQQPAEKKKGFPDWVNLMKPTNEEKDHWVPDEASTKCTASSTYFGAFNRRVQNAFINKTR